LCHPAAKRKIRYAEADYQEASGWWLAGGSIVKPRNIAAFALVVWYILTPPDVSHRASMTPPPDNSEYLGLWKAQHKAEVAIAWNLWVFLLPHVKGMRPMFILDKNVADAGAKGVGKTGIRVWVDSAENAPKVERWVPSKLEGVPVVVEANPELAW
jgi:hypothetical protein